ncbi:MAG: hypothetical protein JWP63_6070 [Candidatus Solibacter sp.]|nr:hypothetical protein [Candidatus Solibacter sp.]
MQEDNPGSATGIARRRGWGWYVLASIVLLMPVYWQPRVQAGDLSSHIYNAWLTELIETGQTQGLVVVRQTTNILFDLMLGSLFRLAGAEFAQRISVSIAVLIFVWGAFRFVTVVGGRRAWHLLPCIAMLAYGWVFHMGFFNFYLSMGLCFWALAATWEWTPRGMAFALPVLLLAYLAHALPVVWTIGLLSYQWLATKIGARRRVYVTAVWLLAMVVTQIVVGRNTFSVWSLQQIKMSTGADQVWVFDGKYYVVLAALLILWGMLFLDLLKSSGARRVVSSVPFQLCVISAAAVVILPTTIMLPGFSHALVYIAERMSLGVGICVCALLGTAIPRQFERYAMLGIAVVFFGFLYRDEKVLNLLEDRMDGVIAGLPPGQRVVSGIDDPELHVFAVTHMIDRACLGRCFSYANYEPSTAQFRVRAVEANPYVMANYKESWKMQNGVYVVQDRDLPLLQLTLDGEGKMALRPLKAGTPCGSTSLKALPALFPLS